MNKPMFKSLLATGTALAGLTLLATVPVLAATSAAGSAKARYLRAIEQCRTIGEHDARANCLSEASTAYAQTQPSAPQENPTQLASNAMRRCDPLPKPDHDDCVARINGAGTVSGSVAGGGLLRELVTREVVAQAPTTPPATAPTTVVPNPLPPTGAGPTPPAPQPAPQPATPGARPSTPPIEPAPADVPPVPPRPPGT
ncbi:MAG TPA: hypothetical protein VGQ91_17440 [Ideonella sp.]|nr:hypothetical protein [Ideonella sp.]